MQNITVAQLKEVLLNLNDNQYVKVFITGVSYNSSSSFDYSVLLDVEVSSLSEFMTKLPKRLPYDEEPSSDFDLECLLNGYNLQISCSIETAMTLDEIGHIQVDGNNYELRVCPKGYIYLTDFGMQTTTKELSGAVRLIRMYNHQLSEQE